MITVFTSCYNQGNYLPEAIESVLNQTYSDFEYLIYDDGSTDNTWEIIQSYAQKDKRIRPFRIPKSPNVGVVINKSIEQARGDVWTWCPSDDVWLPNLLEEKYKEARKYPDSVLYSDWIIIDDHGRYMRQVSPKRFTPEEFTDVVWHDSPIGFTGIWVPMKTFDKAGLFPENLNYSEDYYWMVKATIHDIEFRCVPKVLYKKRTHNNTITGRNRNKILDGVRRIRQELKAYKMNLPEIPRKMYFFWANESMSWLRYMTLYSFKKLNPDWDMELHCCRPNKVVYKPWKDSPTQDFFNFQGKDYFPEVQKLGIAVKEWSVENVDGRDWENTFCSSHKSNIFKWQKMAQDGGFYSDLDILYLKPMDEYYEHVKNTDLIICYRNKYFSIGFLGSSPDNRLFRDIYRNAFSSFKVDKYQTVGVENIYAWLRKIENVPEDTDVSRMDLLDIIRRNYPELCVFNNEMELLYPWTYNRMEDVFRFRHTSVPENCIGIHWYAGDSLSQRYNNLLTEDNYNQFNNTYTYFASRLLDSDNNLEKSFLKQKECDKPITVSKKFLHNSGKQILTDSKPLFSIIVPSYNQAEYLPDALDSIINQTYGNWEAIVVNDGSTDQTPEIAGCYEAMDPRIKLINKENGGVASALNEGIKNAAGQWICWLSSDDMFEPDKLEIHVQAFKRHPEIRFFHTNYYIFDEEKREKCILKDDPGNHVAPVEFQVLHYFDRNCANGISIAVQREVFDHVGLFNEKYRYGQDFDMWLRICYKFRACHIDRKTVVTRWHAQQGMRSFPMRGCYDSARACIEFLNSHTFSECFPVIDLTKKQGAAKAIQETMAVVFNPQAMMYKCYFNTVLLDRMAEWISQYCPDELKKSLVPYLVNFVKNLMNSGLMDKIKRAFQQFFDNIQSDFHYVAHDFDLEAAQYAREISLAGQTERAKDIEAYLSLNTPDKPRSTTIEESELLVSIVMPAYNAAAYIADAIKSVLAQDYENFELIIINDGSTDNTEEIIRCFKDARLNYIRQSNQGAAAAHNVGIIQSKGEYIIRLDCDDMITPDFISRHIKYFEEHPEADLVYCDDYLIDEQANPIRIIENPEYSERNILIRDLFRNGFPVIPFRTCIRKKVFDKIGLFDKELLVGEDYDMMRRFIMHGLEARHLKGALYLRRITERSLSRNSSAQKARSHFDAVRRFAQTFSPEELFPDVNWNKIDPSKRKLSTKCLAAQTFLAIGCNYIKTNSPEVYAREAFGLAGRELRECFKIDPNNNQIRQLIQKCDSYKQNLKEIETSNDNIRADSVLAC